LEVPELAHELADPLSLNDDLLLGAGQFFFGEQARANAAAAELPPLPGATLEAVGDLYDRRIRAQVHHRW
ncbi:hypothetical protein ACWESA_36235, partial [Streptomyces asiaticus]